MTLTKSPSTEPYQISEAKTINELREETNRMESVIRFQWLLLGLETVLLTVVLLALGAFLIK